MNEPRRARTSHEETAAAQNDQSAFGHHRAESATDRRRSRRRSIAVSIGAAAAALGLVAAGLSGVSASAATSPGSATSSRSAIPFAGGSNFGGSSSSNGTTAPGGDSGQGSGSSGRGNGGTDVPDPGSSRGGSTQAKATRASGKESTGVVLIDTKLGYENAEAAGTGVVLSKDGLILTNNHVIADSTQIAVTVATTGKTYEASVVGSDSTKDVAVLKLRGASDLQPAKVDEDRVEVGNDVTAVGNTEGGGELMAVDGTVTALDASVSTTAHGSEEAENLGGMIEVNADIVAGDSGGALLDSQGEVTGIDTAASSGSGDITGFAIPIASALETADSIITGKQTSTITLGYPAFLGIGVAQTSQSAGNGQSSGQDEFPSDRAGTAEGGSSTGENGRNTGAIVSGVYQGTPAAEAGLQSGDTITSIDSTSITDGSQLSEAIGEHRPGDTVSVTWTSPSGQRHTAKVTLTEGPAA